MHCILKQHIIIPYIQTALILQAQHEAIYIPTLLELLPLCGTSTHTHLHTPRLGFAIVLYCCTRIAVCVVCLHRCTHNAAMLLVSNICIAAHTLTHTPANTHPPTARHPALLQVSNGCIPCIDIRRIVAAIVGACCLMNSLPYTLELICGPVTAR